MIKAICSDKKPLVGFFPGFFDMGETYPLIKIAERYLELGGEVVFFSHGGEYEYLAKELGSKIIHIEPITKTGLGKYFLQHNEEDLIQIIYDEALVYKKTMIKALVQTNIFFGCFIAPRVAKIPLISIVSGTWMPDFYRARKATYPDALENFFTHLIPKYLKNQFFNCIAQKYHGVWVKKFYRIAKKIDNDIHLNSKHDIIMGDYTLVCDDIEFLDMKSSKELPLENYIGPILTDGLFKNQDKQRDYDIEKHLKRSGKFILLSMGSRTDKEIFLKILHALNKTYYNVIAVYTSVLKEEDLPVVNDNILLKKFVPSMTKLNKIVDLVIIHGGRGTVYTAAYSGKPVIGIPNIHEQQFNLDCLVRHRMAIRLSKKYFNEKKFLKAVEKIFTNYDFYLKNAQMLSNKLPKHEGDINAAKKIVEILKKEGIT